MKTERVTFIVKGRSAAQAVRAALGCRAAGFAVRVVLPRESQDAERGMSLLRAIGEEVIVGDSQPEALVAWILDSRAVEIWE